MTREESIIREPNLSPAGDKDKKAIVIVDDSPDNLRLLIGILKERDYKIRPAPNGTRALATIRKENPALVLLDIMMPDMNGFEVCKELKADETTKDIPVIFLSALNEVFDKVEAFRVGGVDYISKPFQVEEVLVRVKTHLMIQDQRNALSRQNEELLKKNAIITKQAKDLELLATKDFLTGLSNRRDFLEKAKLEETRFKRIERRFALILLDIDHFKNVNDTYGHDIGDRVLVCVAKTLTQGLRAQDTVARWGGEEFICLLPETDAEGAGYVAEKMRAAIERQQVNTDVKVSVTVTLGICVYDGSCSIETCISHADTALYKGKRKGRNQVRFAN